MAMNPRKEYLFLTIVGLLLLAYVLEAVVDPLKLELPTPYSYLAPQYLAQFPFTTAVIFVRAVGLTLIPLLVFSFFGKGYMAKFIISLIIAGLAQLYSLQEIATSTTIAPLEWSLSLSISGMILVAISIIYLILSLADGIKGKIDNLGEQPNTTTEDENN